MSDKTDASSRMEEARAFYNAFQPKLIADYVYRNERMERAIAEAKAWVPTGSRLLDIGCGIGWSSHEFAAIAERVQAVDLSDAQVALARDLFARDGLHYECCDVTRGDLGSIRFDVVTMLDVYEHIPVDARIGFHRTLQGVMEETGVLFLACPTVHHQERLRQTRPEALQPVDEDVDVEALLRIATDLSGELIHFRYVEVWRPRDYFYAVIQRGGPGRVASPCAKVPANEGIPSRLARLSPLPWGEEVREMIESVRRNHRFTRRLARRLRSLVSRG